MTEESSEGNRFRLCAVSAGTLHDVCQATMQNFGGKMATESESFYATHSIYAIHCIYCTLFLSNPENSYFIGSSA